MDTYEEWRVTGQMADLDGYKVQPYSFTWSKVKTPEYGEPESAARWFLRQLEGKVRWTDGPHLHRRTVTVTDWQAAE